MRQIQIGSMIVLAVVAIAAYSYLSRPAIAQAPPKALEIEKGDKVTVVYSIDNGRENLDDADLVSMNTDWLIVSTGKRKQSFIPVKNILRLDVHR